MEIVYLEVYRINFMEFRIII